MENANMKQVDQLTVFAVSTQVRHYHSNPGTHTHPLHTGTFDFQSMTRTTGSFSLSTYKQNSR